ncbi:MAG TPA: hypothetical protein VG742_19405 [Dongiaceae bacterium]|nr:hypothetical protein [Dongiaceae bacterium]
MVQAVENWCCVSGTVDQFDRGSRNTGVGSDQVVLSIQIGGIKPVAGYPTLIHTEDTAMISVIVRRSQVGEGRVDGRHVTIPVRVAGPDRCFAHPDWSLAGGSAMCGAN